MGCLFVCFFFIVFVFNLSLLLVLQTLPGQYLFSIFYFKRDREKHAACFQEHCHSGKESYQSKLRSGFSFLLVTEGSFGVISVSTRYGQNEAGNHAVPLYT